MTSGMNDGKRDSHPVDLHQTSYGTFNATQQDQIQKDFNLLLARTWIAATVGVQYVILGAIIYFVVIGILISFHVSGLVVSFLLGVFSAVAGLGSGAFILSHLFKRNQQQRRDLDLVGAEKEFKLLLARTWIVSILGLVLGAIIYLVAVVNMLSNFTVNGGSAVIFIILLGVCSMVAAFGVAALLLFLQPGWLESLSAKLVSADDTSTVIQGYENV